MLKKGTLLLFLISCICASAQEAYYMIRTSPSGASVLDGEKNKLGETPFNLEKLKKGVHQLEISMDGYEPVFISFPEKGRVPYSFPASVQVCSSCLMDFSDPAAFRADQSTLLLRKKFTEYDKTIMVAIDTPRIEMAQNEELGKVNSDRKLWKEKNIFILLGYPENMELQLVNSFKDSYLEARFLSSKKIDEATLYKPKIILAPVVKKLRFNLKGKLLRDYTGPCTVECVWEISDISDSKKVLARLPVKTSFYRGADNYDLILHQMLSESERDLLGNDTLYRYFAGLEKNYLSKSKGEQSKLKKPKTVAYPGTREMLKDVIHSVVTVENESSFGSGVIVSEEGYIVTNFHVIEGGKSIYVKSGKDIKVKAEIIKVNKDYDLALIKIAKKEMKPLKFADSDSTSTGDEVFAAGTPLEKSLGQTITRGIISGYREWNGVNFIQTDVSINSGNSGGPLLNSKGEIIGITTMKALGKGIEGIGFGIP